MPRLASLPLVRFAALAGLILSGMTTVGAQEAPPQSSAFDLSLVPADSPVVVSLQSAALLKLPKMKKLYDQFAQADEVKKALDVADPETIEQVTFMLLSRDVPAGNDAGEAIVRNGAIVIKSNKPREWKALAAAMGVPLTKSSHKGKDYYKIEGDDAMGFGFYQRDANTLVVATEANLHKLMALGKDQRLVPLKGETVPLPDPEAGTPILQAVVDFAWIRDLAGPALKADPKAALGFSIVGPIWEKTDEIVLSVSITEDDLTLTADHLCSDEDGAESVVETVEALLTLARNMMPEALKMIAAETKGEPLAAEMGRMGDQALEEASVETLKETTIVRLQTTVTADVARIVESLAKPK